jgi:hypothetical protein
MPKRSRRLLIKVGISSADMGMYKSSLFPSVSIVSQLEALMNTICLVNQGSA